jgi:hypothetical protein
VSKLKAIIDSARKAGIEAYHGSPYDFPAERELQFDDPRDVPIFDQDISIFDGRAYQPIDAPVPEGARVIQEFPLGRFDSSKIGTGEGAQAYGRGSYLAESEDVARGYRDSLASRRPSPTYKGRGYDQLDGPEYRALSAIEREVRYNKNLSPKEAKEAAITSLSQQKKRAAENIDPAIRGERLKDYDEDLSALRAMSPDDIVIGGRMYKVNIDADPDELIDWDELIDEQPKKVMDKLQSADWWPYAEEGIYDIAGARGENPTGADLVRWLEQDGQDYAAEALEDLGIKGVKYADAFTRHKPKDKRSNNYVIFDPRIIEISKKYGISIPLASAVLAGTMTPQEAQAGPGAKALAELAKRADAGDQAAVEGIRAYHGSPYSFDEFSTSQIGTGEGAQAYGRGLYFAEAENVAKGYRDQLSEGLGTVDGESIGGWAAEILDNSKGDPSALRARINMAPDDFWVMNFEEGIAAKDNLLGVVDRLESGVSTWRPGGHMYEVDIDATPDDFLDYDKPLSEQSDRVKEALGIKGQQNKLLALQEKSNELQALYDKALSNVPSNPSFDDLFGDSAALRSQGELLTEKNRIDEEIKLLTTPKDFQLGDRKIPIRVQDYFSGANLIQGQGAASEISKQLLDKGIKGIKYLDQGSRAAGKGTSNYVVFDDKLISIAKKYGVSIPIAAYIAEGIITPEEAQAVGFGSVVKKSLSDKTDEIQQGIGSLPAGDEMVTGGDLQFLMNKLVREQSVKQAKEQGYDLDNVMYHASKQDIEEFVPGYSDGLVFLTPNKEFANDWLGKGKFQERQGGTGSIEGVRAEKKRFMEEANNVLKSLPKDQRQQYFEEILNPQQQQLIKDERLADSAIYPVVTRTKKPFVPSKDVDVLEELYGKEYLDAPFGSGFPTYKDALKDGNYLLYENKEVVDFLKSKGYDSMFLKESSGADKPFTTLAVFDPNNIRSVNAEFDPKKKDSPQILASNPFATGITGLGAMAALPSEEAEAGANQGLVPFDKDIHTPRDVGFGGPSTEYTMTVDAPDGQVAVIPSIWWDTNGEPVVLQDQREAERQSFEYEQQTGKQFPRFSPKDYASADQFAQERSLQGGAEKGPLATYPSDGGMGVRLAPQASDRPEIVFDAGQGEMGARSANQDSDRPKRVIQGPPRTFPVERPTPGLPSLIGQLGLGAMSEIAGAVFGGAAGLGEYVRGGGLLGVPLGEPATAESIRDAREGVAEYVGGLYDAGPEAQELGQEIMQNFGETVSPFIDYAMEGPITDEYGINMVPLIAQKLGIPAYELLERLYYMMPEREQEAAKSGSEVYL